MKPISLLITVVTLSAVGACSERSYEKSVSQEEVEQEVAALFPPDDPTSPLEVACEAGLDARVGAQTTCRITRTDDDRDGFVRVAVTKIVDGESRITAVPFVTADRVADEILDSLLEDDYLVKRVTCADSLAGEVGARVECRATPPGEDNEGQIIATVDRVTGMRVGFAYELGVLISVGPRVVVLTGAGVSAESGVPTFRAADGLWEGHRVEEVASPEGYADDPVLVHSFYNARRRALTAVEPNPAHLALARLEQALGDRFLLVTQNIDDLHERAGSSRVLHMHGELLSALCARCDERLPWTGDLGSTGGDAAPSCPSCGRAELRPDVVWFGEIPYRMSEIIAALDEVDLFVSVGTSGAVYPAAGFVQYAAEQGADTLELNLEPSAGTALFRASRHGPASRLVPDWVEEVLDPSG